VLFRGTKTNGRTEVQRDGKTGTATGRARLSMPAPWRKLYVTGRHATTGAALIVASYSEENNSECCIWRIGQKWFETMLFDWDPRNANLGWAVGAAGSGPDASAPYFALISPEKLR